MRYLRSPRFGIHAAIVLAWLLASAGLVRYEAFPQYFTRTLQGYQAFFGDELIRESWMRIRIGDQPAGYSFSLLETSGERPDEFTRLRNEIHLRLNLMGRAIDLRAELTAALDAWNLLQSFSFTMDAEGTELHVRGRRVVADQFDVRLAAGPHARRVELRIPDNAVLFSPMTELAVRQLRPGQSYTLNTLDPATLTPMPLTLRALRRETIALNGEKREAIVIAASAQGMQTLTWIDADGIALRTETPFGWILEACTIDEAFDALRQAREGLPSHAPVGLPIPFF